MTTTIGLRLLTERKRLGLKQSDIASKLGIGRQTIHRYENNISVPSTKSVQALKTLGFDMDYVLTGVTSSENDITCIKLLELTKQAKAAVSLMDSQTLAQKLRHFSTSVTFFRASDRFESLQSLLQGSSHTNLMPQPSLASSQQTSQRPDEASFAVEQFAPDQIPPLSNETTPHALPQFGHLVVNLTTGKVHLLPSLPVDFQDYLQSQPSL